MHEISGVEGTVTEPDREYELIFTDCSCDLHTKAGMNSPGLCECSRQSILRELKELMPGRFFEIEEVETILSGSSRCRFRIRIRASE